jgi:hypothetical protein
VNEALQIRPMKEADWPAVWQLLQPVFRAGETFPHDPAITEIEARAAWVEQSQAVMVAVDGDGALVGSYYLRPNSLALGAHVANAGYRAMQFNLVVSTNTAGIRCWQRNGFQVVGILPGAFRHTRLGFVDALVMFRSLAAGPET